METSTKYYHLSPHPFPLVESEYSRVDDLASVFHYWKTGFNYLHEVEVGSVSYRFIEDGDNFSPRFFDEGEHYTKEIRSIRCWDLSKFESAKMLLTSGLIQHDSFPFKSNFMSALIEASDEETLSQLIGLIKFKSKNISDLYSVITTDAMIKILPHIEVNDESALNLFKQFFNWHDIKSSDQKLFNQFKTEGVAHSLLYGDAVLVKAIVDSCINNLDIKTSKLWNMIVEILLICDHSYSEIVSKLDALYLSSDACIIMIRMGNADSLHKILELPQVHIHGDPALLLERCIVYNEAKLIPLVSQYINDNTELKFLLYSAKTAVSSQKAIVKSEDLNWLVKRQKTKCDSNLEDAARSGFIQLCSALLTENKIELDELNCAIVAASEGGYVAIVDLLFRQGAKLDAQGNWPIKHSNRYNYPQLTSFLLKNGVKNAYFNDDRCHDPFFD